MKAEHIIALGAIALMVVGGITVVALDGVNREVREKTFADRTELRYVEHCIRGKVVLKISGAVTSDTGYLYDIDIAGNPILCK